MGWNILSSKTVGALHGVKKDTVVFALGYLCAVLVVFRTYQSSNERIIWGTDWGEKGYMRISINPKENCNLYLESLAAM
nr:Bm8172, isoform c [Brugia malayi]